LSWSFLGCNSWEANRLVTVPLVCRLRICTKRAARHRLQSLGAGRLGVGTENSDSFHDTERSDSCGMLLVRPVAKASIESASHGAAAAAAGISSSVERYIG